MGDVTVSIRKKPALFLFIVVLIVITLITFANVRATEPFHNCTQIKAITGRSSIPIGDKLYNPALDRNHNGIACE